MEEDKLIINSTLPEKLKKESKKEQIHPKELSQEEINILKQKLAGNKFEMIKILKTSPIVGVYKGENEKQFQNFYNFFMAFLKAEIGPRGEASKKIRSQLLKQKQFFNKVLMPFSVTAQTHIREIYMKITNFIPCEQYPKYKKFVDAKIKMDENLERLNDEKSEMVKQIKKGLLQKHGDKYDCEIDISKQKANYQAKIAASEKELIELKDALDHCQNYKYLMQALHVMKPYFEEWHEVDSGMGKQSCKTGLDFQEKVYSQLIPYLTNLQKNDNSSVLFQKEIEIFTNLRWIPKDLGQIDIAFGHWDPTEQKYVISVLIQCKSRLFDIYEAFKQVSLIQNEENNKITIADLKEIKKKKKQEAILKNEIKKKNKELKQISENTATQEQKLEIKQLQQIVKPVQEQIGIKKIEKQFLSTKYGPVELMKPHRFYIVTTLPNNQFSIPISSKMKENIEKYTKNMFLEDIKQEQLLDWLQPKFVNIQSPYDWFCWYEQECKKEGKQSNILVVK